MIVHKISVVQGCEKIVQIWNVLFQFVPPCTCMTAATLAVALFSPVHSSGECGPDVISLKGLRNVTHIYTVYIIK
jgi:hypothetical protein